LQLKLLGLILLITNEFKKRKEEKPMQTKENLSQTVKDVKVEIIPKILVSPIKNPQVCYNKAILKNTFHLKGENTLTG